MNKILLSLMLLLGTTLAYGQIHEVGVGLGAGNYVGDVGSTQFINPKDPGFSIFYRLNKSPRHSYRLSYTQTKISGDDARSDMGSRKQRGLNFNNTIEQLALGIEFNFFEFDLHQEQFGLTPYMYLGISAIRYTDLYYRPDEAKDDIFSSNRVDLIKGGKKNSVAVPFALGIKFRLTPSLNINAEVAANYTFTNNLDGSHPSKENTQPYSFGKNRNDWFFFSGITLSYTFGQNPCYCAD